MAAVLPELQQREVAGLSIAEALARQRQVTAKSRTSPKPKPRRPARRYGAPMKVAPKLSAGDDELDAVRRRIDSMSDLEYFKGLWQLGQSFNVAGPSMFCRCNSELALY